MTTRILIDGYNLLFASSVFASNAGPPTLERTRLAFLQFLEASLTQSQRNTTLVVFDAAQAPLGLPHEMTVGSMQIRFSRKPQHADDLLEDLIAAHKQPRMLTVVSSDHRIQRAARQKGATYYDSEIWLSELQSNLQGQNALAEQDKPSDTNWESSPELHDWLNRFAMNNEQLKALETESDLPKLQTKTPVPPPAHNTANPAHNTAKPKSTTIKNETVNFGNPFPPGYAEDLLDND
jgi:uncharacterized protein